MTRRDFPAPADRCPACDAPFRCAIATGSCWCAVVTLSPEQRAQLAAQYAGCLCPACLRDLAGISGVHVR